MMDQSNDSNIPAELAPCGIFCGACPSFHKSCLGCASTDHNQKRSSKWGCKIRVCCYESRKLAFCVQCSEFPCKTYQKKLLVNHVDDPIYQYQYEIPEIILQQYDENFQVYLENQVRSWKCPDCGGTIRFYDYQCDTSGKKHFPHSNYRCKAITQ